MQVLRGHKVIVSGLDLDVRTWDRIQSSVIAPDTTLFSTTKINTMYFSYFTTKIYVVGTH